MRSGCRFAFFWLNPETRGLFLLFLGIFLTVICLFFLRFAASLRGQKHSRPAPPLRPRKNNPFFFFFPLFPFSRVSAIPSRTSPFGGKKKGFLITYSAATGGTYGALRPEPGDAGVGFGGGVGSVPRFLGVLQKKGGSGGDGHGACNDKSPPHPPKPPRTSGGRASPSCRLQPVPPPAPPAPASFWGVSLNS